MKPFLVGLFLLASHAAWSQPAAGTATEHAALEGPPVGPAETASRPCSLAVDTRPLMLTVSGGISLGSYQAGVNWAVLYLLKLAGEKEAGRPDSLGAFHLMAATGASAGNINALFSAAEWAREDFTRRTPESSLFWQMWTDAGLGQLFPEFGQRTTPGGFARDSDYDTGILSRHYLTTVLRDSLFARLNSGPFDACADVAVGITMTRLDPIEVDIARSDTSGSGAAPDAVGLRIRTQRAATVYRIGVGDALGTRLYIGHHDATRAPLPRGRTDSVDRSRRRGPFVPFGQSARGRSGESGADSSWVDCFEPSRFGQLALPAFVADTSDADTNENLALRLALASSAFPVALAPVEITHATGRTAEGWATGYQRRPFADGGVLDNNPLSLAYELYDYAQAPNGEACLPSPRAEHVVPAADSLQWDRPMFVYLDSDDRRPVRAQPEPAPVAAGLQSLWRLVQGLVPSAREHEVEMMTRTMNQEGRNALSITNRLAPVTGDFLGAFGAFVEPSFRQHDFYTGVYDGFHYVASQVICRRAARGRVGCTDEEMAQLHAWSGLAVLSPRADEVYRRLYAEEFGRDRPAATPVVPCPLAGNADPYTPRCLDPERAVVINAVMDALTPEPAGEVVSFGAFISALERNSTARRIMVEWADTCKVRRKEPGDPLALCDAEPYTEDLLDDPENWLYSLAEAALGRARDVEDSRSVLNERGLEIAHAVVAGYRERTERGFQPFPSSIPRRGSLSGKFFRFLPYEVGTQFSTAGGISLTYRPTYRGSRTVAVTLPVTPFQVARVRETVPDLTGAPVETTRTEFRATAGVGGLLRVNGIMSAEARFLPLSYRWEDVGDRWRGDGDGFRLLGPRGEVAAYILSDRLRVGVGFPVPVWGDPEPVSISVAYANASGLAYWVYRLLR